VKLSDWKRRIDYDKPSRSHAPARGFT